MGYVPFTRFSSNLSGRIKPWAKVKKHSSRKHIYHHPVTSPLKYKHLVLSGMGEHSNLGNKQHKHTNKHTHRQI